MLANAIRALVSAKALAAVALLSACHEAIATDAARPNILILCSDDQRPDTIHALGNDVIDTPNLDRLVGRGVTFTRAVTANPLCVPSRAEMLTGCSSFTTGYPYRSSKLDDSLPLWGDTLRKAGYRTWYVGKWHTNGRPTTRGYDETRGLFGSGSPPNDIERDHRGFPITGYVGYQFQDDSGRRFPERGVGLTPDISAAFADAAIELIERKPSEPFFLHVNFTAPHDPRLLPTRYKTKYDPAKMPLPMNFMPEHPFDHGNLRGRDEVLLPFPRTPEDVRFDLAIYYAILTHMDEQIGRVMAALEETGQLDDTIVVFTSDHGLALGSHGLTGKQNMYEHTVGVPLVIAGPGIPRGQKSDAQCYLRDLYPTTCDLAEVEVPGSVEAKSLAAVLRGETDRVYDFVICSFKDCQRMIRGDRWKLAWYPAIDRWQLFDVKDDPNELNDLIDDERHAARIADLREKLFTWLREHNDPVLAQTR